MSRKCKHMIIITNFPVGGGSGRVAVTTLKYRDNI